MTITVELEDRQVLQSLNRLLQATGNAGPALKQIGEHLVDSTKDRFATSTAPDGSPWAANRETTILGYLGAFRGSHKKKGGLSAKGKKRLAGKKPLIGETRSLSTLIHYLVSGDTLAVGSPMEYAGVQQFGAARGEFGETRRGAPIPWGDIPARPFLGLSESDRVEILAILQNHLKDAL